MGAYTNQLIDIHAFKKRFLGVTNESQIQTAQRLHIEKNALSKILNGNQNITLEFLLSVSKEYGCSIDYLLGLSEERTISSKLIDKKTLQASFTLGDFLTIIEYLRENRVIRFSDNVIKQEELYCLDGTFCKCFELMFNIRFELLDRLIDYIHLNSLVDNKQLNKSILDQWIEDRRQENILAEVSRDPFLDEDLPFPQDYYPYPFQ